MKSKTAEKSPKTSKVSEERILRSGKVFSPAKNGDKSPSKRQKGRNFHIKISSNSDFIMTSESGKKAETTSPSAKSEEETEVKKTRSGKKYTPVKKFPDTKSVEKIKRNLLDLLQRPETPEKSPESKKSPSTSPKTTEDSGYSTSNPPAQPLAEVSLNYSDFSDFEEGHEGQSEAKEHKNPADAYNEDTTKITVPKTSSKARPKPILVTSETRQRITAPSPDRAPNRLDDSEDLSLSPIPPSDDSDMEWNLTPPEPWHTQFVRSMQHCSTPIRDQDEDFGDFGNFTPIVGRTPRLIIGDRADSEIGDDFDMTRMSHLTHNFSAIDASALMQESMAEKDEDSLEEDEERANDILAGINRIEDELSTELVDRLAAAI